MSRPPCSLVQHIREFSAELRSQETVLQDVSVNNYREFLRSNICGVIEQSFPLFSQQAGKERVQQLANNFLSFYGAGEAEFHHIATEFVHFMHSKDDTDSEEIKLIEYEWVLFCVEIDPARVITTQIDRQELWDKLDVSVILNPTLKCIRMPFAISQGIKYPPENNQYVVYGIFRNRNNEVLKKKLTPFDCTVFHLIIDKHVSKRVDLERTLSVDNARHLHDWIVLSN